MKKDKQWLRDRYEKMETIKVTTKNSRGKHSTSYLKKKTVINLLNQLDEPEVLSQELPVIPKFVAEWYESEGAYSSWWNWFYKWGRDESRSDLETKTIKWMQDYNEEKFVDMFKYGYTVEEEQKYVVELPNPNNQMGRHKNVFLNKKDGKVFIDSASLFVNDITKYGQFALTEEEIKKDFEWAWKFAKSVEELE